MGSGAQWHQRGSDTRGREGPGLWKKKHLCSPQVDACFAVMMPYDLAIRLRRLRQEDSYCGGIYWGRIKRSEQASWRPESEAAIFWRPESEAAINGQLYLDTMEANHFNNFPQWHKLFNLMCRKYQKYKTSTTHTGHMQRWPGVSCCLYVHLCKQVHICAFGIAVWIVHCISFTSVPKWSQIQILSNEFV